MFGELLRKTASLSEHHLWTKKPMRPVLLLGMRKRMEWVPGKGRVMMNSRKPGVPLPVDPGDVASFMAHAWPCPRG